MIWLCPNAPQKSSDPPPDPTTHSKFQINPKDLCKLVGVVRRFEVSYAVTITTRSYTEEDDEVLGYSTEEGVYEIQPHVLATVSMGESEGVEIFERVATVPMQDIKRLACAAHPDAAPPPFGDLEIEDGWPAAQGAWMCVEPIDVEGTIIYNTRGIRITRSPIRRVGGGSPDYFLYVSGIYAFNNMVAETGGDSTYDVQLDLGSTTTSFPLSYGGNPPPTGDWGTWISDLEMTVTANKWWKREDMNGGSPAMWNEDTGELIYNPFAPPPPP